MHTNNKKSLGYPPFSEGGQKSSLDANSVKENRHNKIKKKKNWSNMKNSTACNYPKGMGASRHFPNMTSPKASEVPDVTLRN